MKVTFSEGSKAIKDTLLKISTNGEEVITLIDIAYYVNQLAVNELRIIDESKFLKRELHFWFEKLIDKAISDAKEGKNWKVEPENFFIDLLSFPYFVKSFAIKSFLENR